MEIFLAPQIPAPLLRICGATPIAESLVRICEVLGYEVRCDGDAGGFEGVSAVVIATHGGAESDLIRAALDAGVGYVGLVASQARGAAVLDEIELSCCQRGRVHTPVGLPIGARTPAEIAVSIAAEVISALRSADLPSGGEAAAQPVPPAASDGLQTAVDPVCGMTVTVASDTVHFAVDGRDFWFCCPGCRSRFAAAQANA